MQQNNTPDAKRINADSWRCGFGARTHVHETPHNSIESANKRVHTITVTTNNLHSTPTLLENSIYITNATNC